MVHGVRGVNGQIVLYRVVKELARKVAQGHVLTLNQNTEEICVLVSKKCISLVIFFDYANSSLQVFPGFNIVIKRIK